MDYLKMLKHTMETLVEVHTRLLDLVREKQHILVKGDTHDLQNMVHRESLCVADIQKLESKRNRLVQEFFEQKGIKGPSFTLEEIMKIEDDSGTNTSLKIIAKQLRVLIQEITHINESNQQLIHTSLSYVQYSIGMLVRKEVAIGYGPHAVNSYSNLLDAKI
ncbi:hypothetical protein BACCIP111895_00034 [Neobacillus rhizosphaerae]|uniref:Flagellar biosynthesis protein FlgN n=1 Tax=Neobacillus rhizosphaerae TaxID=2880965 RepID=A0ABM9EK04_9BACI|nr:flagellar protein FlgN [Neobacillus rhizosphaerae]CAH2712901.1 hypothetical protein BACCIP111895_00034 [Neobacillus rhizosphaerae]